MDGTPCAGGVCEAGACSLTTAVLPCTEQGIRNAVAAGGGIENYWLGTLTLTNSTVSANQANYGGGIWNAGTLTLLNSTMWGNSATARDDPDDMPDRDSGKGGGILNGFGTLKLTNTTVSGNTAVGVGTGIASLGGALKLTNSTVSGSVVFTVRRPDPDDPPSIVSAATLIEGACDQIGGVVNWTSNGYNIESPGNTCGFDQQGDQSSVPDAMLGPLQNNGGLTDTHALLPGSPAINRIPATDCVDADGEPLTEDQRGLPRPEPGGTMCDVGSFELQQSDVQPPGGGGTCAVSRQEDAPVAWFLGVLMLIGIRCASRRRRMGAGR